MDKAQRKLSDHELLLGLRTMDNRAVNLIYQKFYPMILNLILKNNGTADDARDVFQDTIMILYEKCRQTDFKLTSGLGTFIYAISRNIWLKKQSRTYSREYTTSDDILFDLIKQDHEEPLKSERLERLKLLFQKISEKCQQILRLKYYAGMKDKDIAVHLNLSGAAYVKTQRNRCINKLRDLF